MAQQRHPQGETTTERPLACAAPFCDVPPGVARDCSSCPAQVTSIDLARYAAREALLRLTWRNPVLVDAPWRAA